jgi:type I restriction enzyme M protein
VQYQKLFESYTLWCEEWLLVFENLSPNSFKPKVLIEEMGISVLKYFSESLLVDKYDVYDQLMNYWIETMQDDFYLIEADGWKVETHGRASIANIAQSKKTKEAKTIHDIACDLLPVNCIVDEYFPTQKEQIARIEELIAQTEASIAELCEEFAEDYLNPAEFKDEKINAANAKRRLKEVTAKEAEIIKKYLRYHEIIGDYKKQLKQEHSELLTNVLNKYTSLPEKEIKRLVTNKWTNAFGNRLAEESQRISQSLNSRLIALAERYEETLTQINVEVEMYEEKVMDHLVKMGFKV